MMKPVHDERLFAPVNFADAKDMRLSYLGRLTASLAEKRRLGFDLNDIHVDKRLLADDGWEGYRQIIAQNAAIILAQRSPPEGGPWSAELVILDAEEWPRLCSLVAQPDGRLITWGPAPAPEGIRIAEVDAGGADAVWKLIRGARGRPVYPAFVFHRRREAEVEMGFVLAGQLFFDIGKRKRPTPAQSREIADLIDHLTAAAKAGEMLLDGLVVGWAGGAKPSNAVDPHDDATMKPWAKRVLTIAVQVPQRGDRSIPLDRDLLRQLGDEPTEH
jgi:hypothetical protein